MSRQRLEPLSVMESGIELRSSQGQQQQQPVYTCRFCLGSDNQMSMVTPCNCKGYTERRIWYGRSSRRHQLFVTGWSRRRWHRDVVEMWYWVRRLSWLADDTACNATLVGNSVRAVRCSNSSARVKEPHWARNCYFDYFAFHAYRTIALALHIMYDITLSTT